MIILIGEVATESSNQKNQNNLFTFQQTIKMQLFLNVTNFICMLFFIAACIKVIIRKSKAKQALSKFETEIEEDIAIDSTNRLRYEMFEDTELLYIASMSILQISVQDYERLIGRKVSENLDNLMAESERLIKLHEIAVALAKELKKENIHDIDSDLFIIEITKRLLSLQSSDIFKD